MKSEIDYKHLYEITEKQRQEWADMCISKQRKIDELTEKGEYLNEELAIYQSDYKSLQRCVDEILTMTDDSKIIELINNTAFHLCANMK